VKSEEIIVKHPVSGEERWFESRAYRDKIKDNLYESYGVISDITDRKTNEQVIKYLELALDVNKNNAVWLESASFEHIYSNPTYKEIYGHSLQEFEDSQKLWSDTIHPDCRGSILKRWANDTKNHTDDIYKFKIIVNKQTKHLITKTTWLEDKDTGRWFYLGITEDITKSVWQNYKLKRSRQALRENPLKAVWIRKEGSVKYELVNKAYTSILGFTPKDCMLNKDLFYECIHISDRERIREMVKYGSINHTPYTYTCKFITRDKQEKYINIQTTWFEVKAEKEWYYICYASDVTKEKANDKENRALRRIADKANYVTWIAQSKKGGVKDAVPIYVSDNTEKIIGIPHSEYYNSNIVNRAVIFEVLALFQSTLISINRHS